MEYFHNRNIRAAERAKMTSCGYCGCRIDPALAEYCWYCGGRLCGQCWEEIGHCGHTEAYRLDAELVRRAIERVK